MFARPSKTGRFPRAYRKILWRHSGRAATSSASRKNGQRKTPTTFHLMPNLRCKPYLAFDFGAESGRAVLAQLQSGILTIEEVHRFPNEPVEYGGSLHWDAPRLWYKLPKARAGVEEMELAGMGVDAGGVDYAFLEKSGNLLQKPYPYPNRRTQGLMEEVNQRRG